MCCFAGSARVEVHRTSIFARFTKPGTQALVYKMQYASTEPTAMILPLPVALPSREDSVRFRSLKEYPTFFEDLARGFPSMPREDSFSRGERSAAVAAQPDLVVHDVGDFIASFVPSQADFGRVDKRFVIAPDVWAKIPEYRDYGFAVVQLKELSGGPHPIAFEFDTRTPSTLYYPTVHIHDGTVHAKDDFDHVLYAQDVSLDRRAGDYEGPSEIDSHTSFVRSKDKVATFADASLSLGMLSGDLLVHKKTLSGLLPNRDTTFSMSDAPVHGAACSRCNVSSSPIDDTWLPVAATALGLGWILQRRNKLGRRR